MKTVPILIALLLVGNAFGWDASDEAFARSGMCKLDNCKGGGATSVGTVDIPDRGVVGGPKLSSGAEYTTKPVDPNVQWAASPSKVDYSIVTLPSGETASVLTFK
jgi:hypothetical protein